MPKVIIFSSLGNLSRPLKSQVLHVVFFVSCVVSPFPFILNIYLKTRWTIL